MRPVAPPAVDELRTTAAIRDRSRALFDRARDGGSAWFTVDESALGGAADLVADVTAQNFPDLDIPFHSRWRHFEAGGVDRTAALRDRMREADAAERARALIDLAVVSVLLDAGSGPHWAYREADTGQSFTRSEGLGVASWHAFCAGVFSSDPARPLRADAAGLTALDTDRLAAEFQLGPDNPLVGFEGRVELLRRLGEAVTTRPDTFTEIARPGGLYDTAVAAPGGVTAHGLLTALLSALSGIWLSDNTLDGQPLGDCWRHDAAPGGWVPFHKLSQWLTYSLLEPFAWAGAPVAGIDALTGLPEYRNGGLFLDTGVLALRDPAWAQRSWTASDEIVVEWRALTVTLLDDVAEPVRERLGREVSRMPLARILEGGTWAAGRQLAQRLRGGLPPLTVLSDGTVF